MKHARICVLAAFTASISYGQPSPGDSGRRPALQRGVRTASATRNADWPRWRGPNADGVADGQNLPTQWSQTENVRWSVKLPGWGTSSPAIYGDRLFVTSQVEQGGKKSLLTLCVHRDTGKELWRHRTNSITPHTFLMYFCILRPEG
jgi:hypothetical protein